MQAREDRISPQLHPAVDHPEELSGRHIRRIGDLGLQGRSPKKCTQRRIRATEAKTIGEMMEVANRWADGEESLRNNQARSPRDDGDGNHSSERRKRRKTREGGDSEFVAAEFSKQRDGAYRGIRDWKLKTEEKPICEQ